MNNIENSYAVGAVSGADLTGGLVGCHDDFCTITNSYYDQSTTGQTDTTKGTPLTTAEMKDQANFINWDFIDIWSINNSYPFLQSNE